MIDNSLRFSILTRSRDDDYIYLSTLGNIGVDIENCLKKIKIDSKRGVLGWASAQTNMVVIWGEGNSPRLDKDGRPISIALLIKISNEPQLAILKNLLNKRLVIINSLNKTFEKCFNKSDLKIEFNNLNGYFKSILDGGVDDSVDLINFKNSQWHSPLVKEDDLFVLSEIHRKSSHSSIQHKYESKSNPETPNPETPINLFPTLIKDGILLGSVLVVGCLAFVAGHIFNAKDDDILKKNDDLNAITKLNNEITLLKEELNNKNKSSDRISYKPIVFTAKASGKVDFSSFLLRPENKKTIDSWGGVDVKLYCYDPNLKNPSCINSINELRSVLDKLKISVPLRKETDSVEFLILPIEKEK